jgi:hypothetical protein
VIGEAVKALPADLLDQHPQIPWREIARLRDLLAHHYYRVDGCSGDLFYQSPHSGSHRWRTSAEMRRLVDQPRLDLQTLLRAASAPPLSRPQDTQDDHAALIVKDEIDG